MKINYNIYPLAREGREELAADSSMIIIEANHGEDAFRFFEQTGVEVWNLIQGAGRDMEWITDWTFDSKVTPERAEELMQAYSGSF